MAEAQNPKHCLPPLLRLILFRGVRGWGRVGKKIQPVSEIWVLPSECCGNTRTLLQGFKFELSHSPLVVRPKIHIHAATTSCERTRDWHFV